jgi:RNA polymerase sigma-70 factor (ECF subfamily)
MDAATPQPGNITLAAAESASVLLTDPELPGQLAYGSAEFVPASLHAELQIIAAEHSLTPAELARALATIGTKHNFGLPPGSATTSAQQEKFLHALQLADLALAQACALGREPAWQQFLTRFRAPLRQAAIAVTGSSSLGEDLADSLYAELFGLSERAGERRSPLASYTGRGSLMGWLRSTLAQRHVDRHRRTWRESPLPEPGSGFEHAATTPENPPEDLTRLSYALAQVLQQLAPEDRFLLASYFLDQHTLLEIARLLRVHEATISRKLKRLTTDIHKQLLKQLQASGLSRRAAEEAMFTDPRDLTLNLRTLLQTSPPATFQVSSGHS